MFNNVALDAVIGLALIYLLYSMLVSMIAEFISNKLGLRARILRVAIERMLNDGYYKKKSHKKDRRSLKAWWRGWWQRNLLYESKYFHGSFAGRFYDYPSIKFLARVDQNQKFLFALTKPSYITPATFADTLILLLKEHSLGTADLDRITYALTYNLPHIQPETLKNVRNLFDNADGDLKLFHQFLMDWFKETNDRATGWFKRKLALVLVIIGFIIASVLNVDSIQIAQLLSKDKLAREQLVNMGIQLNKDTARHLNSFKGIKDSIRGKAVLDTGLSKVSKDINTANLILGIGWRYDTLYTYDKLKIAKDDPKYSYAWEEANLFNKAHDAFIKSQTAFTQNKKALETLRAKLNLDQINIAVNADKKDTSGTSKISLEIKRLLQSELLLPDIIRHDSLRVISCFKSVVALQRPLITQQFFWISRIQLPPPTEKDKPEIYLIGKMHYSACDMMIQLLKNTFHHFCGLFLTALALSLGAPFWFNVLGKLVAIRASGPKPESKPQNPPSGGGGNDPDAGARDAAAGTPANGDGGDPDPACQALDELTGQLKNEQGIVSVTLNMNGPSLTVAVADDNGLKYLKINYPAIFKSSTGFNIQVDYETQSEGQPFADRTFCGYGIINPNGSNGKGTLGTYLTKSGSTTIYLMSCWHVLKENQDWSAAIPDEYKSICGDDGKEVGTVFFGAVTPTYDAGIATTTLDAVSKLNQSADPAHRVIKQHRPLSLFDEQSNTQVWIYKRGAAVLIPAQIFRINVNPTLPYDGRSYTMYGAFSLNKPEGGCPSEVGDSGAMVIDSQGIPLGMIYGGNDEYAFAIKFSNLLDKNKPFCGYSIILNPPT